RVIWDGIIVVDTKRDLVEDIFGGNTEVIWGFTASTGRAHNLQYFCLKRLVDASSEGLMVVQDNKKKKT
ncbi:MAG: hypothetical protein KI790_16450, partial [Cyclobacteriaceae bacterium]|nr:hypothetical protein [Cyclobacteriaceae bacterium HetDA_MAG_MS6]